MEWFVEYAQCTEYEVHHFVTEASDLGLPPGPWPGRIETDMGNGQPWVLRKTEKGGQVAVYLQQWGCIQLRVFND